ncbi:MAG: hypothetical protein WKF82_12510 [Nocardioidaceae bacterium]
MFDSMQMHMPVVVALVAAFLFLLLGALFVAVRVLGQRAVDEKPSERTRPLPDDRS